MLACDFLTSHTKTVHLLFCIHYYFEWIQFFSPFRLTIAGAVKGKFICISVIVSAIFLHLVRRWRKKFSLMNGNLCTWEHQIIHPIRATSINAFLVTSPVFASLTFVRTRREKNLSVNGFWWQQEICDDVHLNKQLNEAGLFMMFLLQTFLSLMSLPVKTNHESITHHLIGFWDVFLKRFEKLITVLLRKIITRALDNPNKSKKLSAICITSPNLTDCLHCWTSTLQFPPDKNAWMRNKFLCARCLLKSWWRQRTYLFEKRSWLSEY